MKLAARAARLPAETAFDQAERLRRAGIPFINFAWGDPDLPTPAPIKAATSMALARDETRYSDTSGLPELREAIAGHVSRTRGAPVSWEEVIVLPGANPGIFLGLLMLVGEGDEVIYPSPGYPLYPTAIETVGAIPVPLPLRPELGYTFDPQELRTLVTGRTRAILVNSPHNPTGSVLGPEHLAALAEAAASADLWVLSDEVYSDLVYVGESRSLFSLPEARERVLLISSFSKTFAMTGWRLGYAVGPRPLIERLGTLFSLVDYSVNTFIQYGGIEALRHHDEVAAHMRAIYRERRDLIVAGLGAIPGICCPAPAGSFYVFPEVTEACRRLGVRDAAAFQARILEECRVALLARDWFGPRNPGEVGEFVRLSYTLPLADIEEGIRRIEALVAGVTSRTVSERSPKEPALGDNRMTRLDLPAALAELGLPEKDLHDHPSSTYAFPDGGHYRFEVSGVEDSFALEALLDEAEKRGVFVHRLIGSVQGAALLTRQELREYAELARDAGIEVVMPPFPSRAWDTGRVIATAEGYMSGIRIRGADSFAAVLRDIARCLEAGIRAFLVVDEGLLVVLDALRQKGVIPPETGFKFSVYGGHANPAAMRLLEQLGASTVNPLPDLSLAMLAAIRRAIAIPMDVYVSCIESWGGMHRFHEAVEIVRLCSPCYLKIEPGRSEMDHYKPWLTPEFRTFWVRQKVKYAAILQELLEEAGVAYRSSPPGTPDLRVPRP